MTDLTHASFFSGIGAFDLGFERAGIRSVSYSEVKPFAMAVHATHWPDLPNLGDLNTICGEGGVGPNHPCPIPRATVWTGGFPCSDVSVMGKRRGIEGGKRSSLALVFLDLVDRHRPDWIVLENVPGLLSSRAGKDLGALLGTLVELGYGWAYRLLDARDFGLPQGRRRVFIVAGPTANGAGAVLDDATPRRLALAPLGGAGGAAVAGGRGGPAADRGTVVIGPTYSRSGDSASISRLDTTFPLTPSNEQYVIEPDDPQPISLRGFLSPRQDQRLQSRDDGVAHTILPGIGLPYVIDRDPDGPIVGYLDGHGLNQRADGSAFAVRPGSGGNQEQYVVEPDEPAVLSVYGKLGYGQRRGSAASISPPDPRHGNAHDQYVVESAGPGAGGDGVLGGGGPGLGGDGGQPVLFAGVVNKMGVAPTRQDGATYALVPSDRYFVVLPDEGAEADPDGVREAAGVPGRLDDPDGGDAESVWPERLDTSRWHVLGRTLPVPVAEWIGDGLRTVVESLAADPHAYDDPA